MTRQQIAMLETLKKRNVQAVKVHPDDEIETAAAERHLIPGQDGFYTAKNLAKLAIYYKSVNFTRRLKEA